MGTRVLRRNGHRRDLRYWPRAHASRYCTSCSSPMVMSCLPLYRRVEDNAQLMEFKCVEFAEEKLYGHLRKQD